MRDRARDWFCVYEWLNYIRWDGEIDWLIVKIVKI